MGRFPQPIPPVDLPRLTCAPHLLWRSPDRDFDEYEQGPTLQALERVENLTLMEGNLNLVYLAEQIISNPWTTFKDYGYRLEPKFLQQFHLTEPVLTREHMMVVGLRQPSPPSEEMESTVQKTRRGDLIQVFDRVVMGAQEMIDAADAERDDSLFVTGTTSEGNYIYVDLCRDAVQVSEDDYVRSCDIDSLIWISKHPRVAQAANIFTAPVIRDKAPIAKHNHVYVDVLLPPSEADRGRAGGRTEWVERRFRLSRIPHLALGKMGDAGCNVNILMFFPRMPHQHPHTFRWANKLPPHLLNIFWDQVVIPAMRSTTDQYRHAHVGLDRDHVTFKQRKGAQNKVSTVPFQPDAFWQLTKSISDLVSRHDDEGEEDLEMFGSAFYVFEVKGSQKHTNNTESEEKPLDQSLRQAVKDFRHQFSCLDWEYMEDREHGELICDVGFTINARHPEPLVGLWRLDCLEASYGAAGYLRGNIHRINTLSHYGAMQAETPRDRAESTHVMFRSSYNQAYEVVRSTDNTRNLFLEKDVYNLEKSFLSDSKSVCDLYDGRPKKLHYGVRDEFRISGLALKELDTYVDEMTRDFLSSGPIVWIRSSVWFEFLRRRVRQLTHLQELIHGFNLPNYGIISGLMSYLMQSVLSTPTMVNSYVRESLGLLNFKASTDRHGMFFLHELDLTRDHIIPGILECDDLQVQRILGIAPKRSQNRRRPGDIDEDMYPLGSSPSWRQVRGSLESKPWELMRDWNWSPELEAYMGDDDAPSGQRAAGDLFAEFTRHLWLGLNAQWQSSSERAYPQTVKEALETWSVDAIAERVKDPKFLACNAGLQGNIPGKKDKSFSDRVSQYFRRDYGSQKGFWRNIAEEAVGFGSRYMTVCDTLEDDEIEELNGHLGTLLSYCQCLPRWSSKAPWVVSQGHVQIDTNPRYYRLVSIGDGSALKRSRRSAPALTGAKAMRIGMLEMRGFDSRTARRAVNQEGWVRKAISKARSKKAKNRRGPPRSKKRIDSD
ncbi:hypothetical protein FPV67DRAFT_1430061 [Lyophyllum atratum]|nr:hypothetical protein FPV67DRAFT_1440318 [Lyophyllum atratum]KAF8057353.1 hypothetical protein FPV67DRAFT_1430061 [Lyophyllum atratum]